MGLIEDQKSEFYDDRLPDIDPLGNFFLEMKEGDCFRIDQDEQANKFQADSLFLFCRQLIGVWA